MTKEEVVQLGVAALQAQEYFNNLGLLNVQTDPVRRLEQAHQYESARADMVEARNRHQAALSLL
jgi:hypothetical protein